MSVFGVLYGVQISTLSIPTGNPGRSHCSRVEKVREVSNLHWQMHFYPDSLRVDDTVPPQRLVVSQDRCHLHQEIFDKHSNCIDSLPAKGSEFIQGGLHECQLRPDGLLSPPFSPFRPLTLGESLRSAAPQHLLTCLRTEWSNWHVQYMTNASVSTNASRSTMNLPMAVPGRGRVSIGSARFTKDNAADVGLLTHIGSC